MRIVIQKTHQCTLSVGDKEISHIANGLLVFVGIDRYDDESIVEYMARKISHMRLFKDNNDKINRSVLDENGEIMVVSNFTLNAVISSGTRPSFSNSAEPDKAERLYLLLAQRLRDNGVRNVTIGQFGAHMHLSTTLDGPFNIVLERFNSAQSIVD